MSRRARRTVVVSLTAEEWDRLDRAARLDERDPWQQARWLILRALEPETADDDLLPDEPERTAALG